VSEAASSALPSAASASNPALFACPWLGSGELR
jgi:hypothetical protein